jgi:putative ABC transport system ATP-binding protein
MESMNITDLHNYFPQQLSINQQQSVAICKAAVGNPKLILADDPARNLDSTNGLRIMEFFEILNQQGISIIVMTESFSIATHAKRIIRLTSEKVVNI